MRLWTLHPAHLDSKGLVAAWREALLAQKVLAGKTRGYRHHPQLTRFRSHPRPLDAIAAFLRALKEEARARGYRFDAAKIASAKPARPIAETRGQLLHEWRHLRAKLRVRAPALYRKSLKTAVPEAHPAFRIVAGGVRDWERPAPARRR